MRKVLLTLVFATLLADCTQKQGSSSPAPGGDAAAGKVVAERDCKACHGLDGKGLAPGIPNLAAQRASYLFASLKEYKEGKRSHAALRDMMASISDQDGRDVVAYYAAQPPVAVATAADAHDSPFEQGRKLAQACGKCHGETGNSKTPGTPSLAGQQPHYLVAAIQEYHRGERGSAAMRSMLRGASKSDLDKLALYFASQEPISRSPPPFGNVAAGEPLSAVCGGCHGARGVSTDAATPSLAGQDAQYLMKSIQAYRTTRQHWGMQRFVAGLSDKDMQNIAAFYSAQTPRAAGAIPAAAKDLAGKCDRCHDVDDNAAIAAPKMRGQDRDYLIMALRAYRDGKRESSTMHNMSSVYSDAIIENVSSYYAAQPAR